MMHGQKNIKLRNHKQILCSK